MTPKHTRESINRIGKLLVAGDLTPEQRAEVIDLFNDWRALHLAPLNTFNVTLRKFIKDIDPENGIVSLRLKRMPTIIDKLKNRHQSMNLGRLQDVGGLRAIVADVARVRMLEKKYDKSRAQHKLLRKYDYITEPKESGYRGIHLVYAYSNVKKPDCHGLFIEIQLRTRLQHLWATAVETVGTFFRESLKSSQGSAKWLGFFKLVSALFALEEKEQPHNDYRNTSYPELLKLFKNFMDENAIFASLETIRLAAATTDENLFFTICGPHNETSQLAQRKLAKYWVIESDGTQSRLTRFGKNQEQQAKQEYQKIESSQPCQSGQSQVVLVSVNSLKKIRTAYSVKRIQSAYPNFFLNITDFSKELKRLYDAAG